MKSHIKQYYVDRKILSKSAAIGKIFGNEISASESNELEIKIGR